MNNSVLVQKNNCELDRVNVACQYEVPAYANCATSRTASSSNRAFRLRLIRTGYETGVHWSERIQWVMT
jgi:hypothetical protein